MFHTLKSLLLLTLFLALPMSVQAQEKPGVKHKAGSEPMAVPDPVKLRADWWHYFDVTGKRFEKHLARSQKRFDGLVEALDPELRDHADEQSKRLLEQLRELPDLRRQKGKLEPPPAPVFKKAYTLDEWLTIAREVRTKDALMGRERELVERLKQKLSASQKQYETDLASYLRLKETDPARPRKGLAIMLHRSLIEILSLKQSRRNRLLKQQEQKLKGLQEQDEVAAQRLAASFSYLRVLEKAITVRRAKLAKKQKEQGKTQDTSNKLKRKSKKNKKRKGRNSSVQEREQLDRILSHLRFQQEEMAGIEKAELQIELANLLAKKLLARLILEQGGLVISEAYAQIDEQKGLINEVGEQRATFEKNSRWQQNQAQLALSQAQSRDLETSKLFKTQRQRLDKAQHALILLQKLNSSLEDLALLNSQSDVRLALARGQVGHWWTVFVQKIAAIWSSIFALFTRSLFTIGDTPVTMMGLLRAVAILAGSFFLSRGLQRAMMHLGERQKGDASPALYSVGRLAHYAILLIGGIVALSTIGLDFANLALIAGALSVGIGFGLQSIVNNFVSGLILLFEQPLKVGDFVELESGLLGEVKEINVRSTLITTRDNYDIVVPNSEIINNRLTNLTLTDAQIRIHIPFGVAYATDKELVKRTTLEAADRVAFTVQTPGRAPQVRLTAFGNDALEFELVVWINSAVVKRHGWIKSAYLWEIETLFGREKIEFPFPQVDLHMKTKDLGRVEVIQKK